MQTFSIANLRVTEVRSSADRICYVLFPLDGFGQWIEQAAARFGVSIVAISGMDWDDDLTPWPAEGQPPGSPDFRGKAPATTTSSPGSASTAPSPGYFPPNSPDVTFRAERDKTILDYLPVPKREVSMLVSLGLKPLNRQMNVSLRLRDISRTFIR